MAVMLTEPPVDAEGLPLVLGERDLFESFARCAHVETFEAGTGKMSGRFSSGNEFIAEVCVDCGKAVGGYWTGGVL